MRARVSKKFRCHAVQGDEIRLPRNFNTACEALVRLLHDVAATLPGLLADEGLVLAGPFREAGLVGLQ